MGKRSVEIAKFLFGIEQLVERKKLDTAEKFLREFLENNQYYPVTRKLGKVLRLNKKEEEAIEVLIPLLYTPECANAAYEISYAYATLGEYEKSLEYLDICIKNKDKNFPPKKLLYLNEYIQDNLQRKEEVFECQERNAEDILNHIIERHGYNEHIKTKSYFDEKIDIELLLNKMSHTIKTDLTLKYCCDGNTRKYYFNYPAIGYDANQTRTHLLAVVTDYNLNIITMYPTIDCKNCEFINDFKCEDLHIDINPEKTKKKQSPIDKFYKKYGEIK